MLWGEDGGGEDGRARFRAIRPNVIARDQQPRLGNKTMRKSKVFVDGMLRPTVNQIVFVLVWVTGFIRYFSVAIFALVFAPSVRVDRIMLACNW